jgi:drug/metabolite transporter (DMT)-like permease
VTAAGVLVALAAAVANAFAIVLQASEARGAPISRAGRLSLLIGLVHRRRWLAGTALLVVAWPLQVLALGLAPITVVQPTLATSQVVLLGVARVKLRERVGFPEALGVATIVAGIALVVWAAPRHTALDAAPGRLAQPLAVVGAAAVAAYAVERLQNGASLLLVIGAGLAYAWVDFANKLLANDIATAHWGLAIVWLAATICVGALAFLQETSALQRRPAVTVAPVVSAVQSPLPVLMALWSGVEMWGPSSDKLAPLAAGLLLVTVGGSLLGRSRAAARVSSGVGWPPDAPPRVRKPSAP